MGWKEQIAARVFVAWPPDETKCSVITLKTTAVEAAHNRYKEPKEIYPSESNYLHTTKAESWDMEIPGGKHHKECWGPTVLFIRHPRCFFLVSEFRIREDTLNCWQE